MKIMEIIKTSLTTFVSLVETVSVIVEVFRHFAFFCNALIRTTVHPTMTIKKVTGKKLLITYTGPSILPLLVILTSPRTDLFLAESNIQMNLDV